MQDRIVAYRHFPVTTKKGLKVWEKSVIVCKSCHTSEDNVIVRRSQTGDTLVAVATMCAKCGERIKVLP